MQPALPVEWFTIPEAAARASVDPTWLEQATPGGWVTSPVVRGERLAPSWALEDVVD